MWFIVMSLPEGYCHLMLCVFKGTFTSRLFSTQLVTEAGKFGLPIGRLSESTNKQPELSQRQNIGLDLRPIEAAPLWEERGFVGTTCWSGGTNHKVHTPNQHHDQPEYIHDDWYVLVLSFNIFFCWLVNSMIECRVGRFICYRDSLTRQGE